VTVALWESYLEAAAPAAHAAGDRVGHAAGPGTEQL